MTTDQRPETMLVMSDDTYRDGFDRTRLDRLRSAGSVSGQLCTSSLNTTEARRRLAGVEVLITGWGAPRIDADVLAHAPRLRAILHTAGSVKWLADPVCWERGLLITSAVDANAVPVAEYTLAAILFAGKRVPESAHMFHQDRAHKPRPAGTISNSQRTVGVIGYSSIGRRVVDLLRPFDLDVLVTDPYADPDQIATAGAHLVDLDTLLTRSDIVSIHAPANPETQRLLDERRLALIPTGGTVINTARGMIIDTAALEAECATGRLSAVLDVTEPEPLPADSPLWDLPNVMLTPHVAGAQTTEVRRLVDAALDELDNYRHGRAPLHPITAEDLRRIA